MSLPAGHPPFTGGRHTLTRFVRAADFGRGPRTLEVAATPEELAYLAEQGFLVRERYFGPERLVRLRAALDEVIALEGKDRLTSRSRNYGGVFLRHLMDKHAAFLEFVHEADIISIARALLGPLVAMRGLSARVSEPGGAGQETEWHYHLRVFADPPAPWFMEPQLLDVLIYLDGADEAKGRLCVVPGSHRRLVNEDLPPEQYADRPDQLALDLEPGSIVFTHGNLWHRATPTRPHGSVRRLLLWGFGPTWLKPGKHGEPPADGLTRKLLAETSDPSIRELLGAAGWL